MHRLDPPISIRRAGHEKGVLKILKWEGELGFRVKGRLVGDGVDLVDFEDVVVVIDTVGLVSMGIFLTGMLLLHCFHSKDKLLSVDTRAYGFQSSAIPLYHRNRERFNGLSEVIAKIPQADSPVP